MLMNYTALSGLFSTDLAIDLGTANTLVFAKDKGIVIDEPSVVAINKRTGQMEAVGEEANAMIGRTPGGIEALKPMRDGVIADFSGAERMLNFFVQKAHDRKYLVHPRIIIGVPSEITPVEKRAVLDSAYRAKAREVYLVDQAMMGALGAGLPITEPGGNLIVDIGGGTTDVAVISLSGVVYARSVRVAGNAMDAAIMDYLKHKHNLLIGDHTAERVKINVGSAYPVGSQLQTEVKGRDLQLGMPKTVTVSDGEIREALAPVVSVIISAVRNALEHTPPELSGDIFERGVVLTGGGAFLRGLDAKIRHETGLPVAVAAEPLTSVVNGTGKMLNDLRLLRRMSMN
jgi:rod shape-determining protein MreB and related proteins